MKSFERRLLVPVIGMAVGVACLLLAGTWLAGDVSQAQSRLFTVNSVLDEPDAQPGNGVCETAPDNGLCTLRAAVQESNALPGADTVVLPTGVYTLTLAGAIEDLARFGDLDVRDDLTMAGAGASTTVIDGNALDRVIDVVDFGSEVIISGVTIRNGNVAFPSRAADDWPWTVENGGCVLSMATLALRDSIVTGCRAGRMGGGIYAEGELVLDNTTVAGNLAGEAGGGVFVGQTLYVVPPGPTPVGPTVAPIETAPTPAFPPSATATPVILETPTPAPITPTPGATAFPVETPPTAVLEPTATWTPFLFETPTPRATPTFGVPTSTPGPAASSHASITNSLITNNNAGRGGGIVSQGWTTLSASQVISNTAGEAGGGVLTMHFLKLEHSTVRGNLAGEYGGGIANQGWGAYSGAMLMLEGSTVSGNISLGRGGGIANGANEEDIGYHQDHVILTNSTISGNEASASGGGLYTGQGERAFVSLDNGTITANVADADGNGQGDGGGIFNRMGMVWVRNTLLAGNHDSSATVRRPDCWTPRRFESGGNNLIGDASTCPLDGDLAGNLLGVAPRLDPLGDNGGDTQTHALQANSPAIDGGNPTGCIGGFTGYLAVDQRGYMRTVDGNGDGQGVCDIGAYEFGAAQPVYRYLPLLLAQ
jgi:CSLREA domain-containing protein